MEGSRGPAWDSRRSSPQGLQEETPYRDSLWELPWGEPCAARQGTIRMLVEAHVTIQGSASAVWSALTDMENAPKIIRGIQKIEILQRPGRGLVGLRWKETRLLFGKPATVEKWITEATPNQSYATRAESDGFVFVSKTTVSESKGIVTVSTAHDSRPQGFVARVKGAPMFLFKGVVRKALLQDLNDIKAAIEKT